MAKDLKTSKGDKDAIKRADENLEQLKNTLALVQEAVRDMICLIENSSKFLDCIPPHVGRSLSKLPKLQQSPRFEYLLYLGVIIPADLPAVRVGC